MLGAHQPALPLLGHLPIGRLLVLVPSVLPLEKAELQHEGGRCVGGGERKGGRGGRGETREEDSVNLDLLMLLCARVRVHLQRMFFFHLTALIFSCRGRLSR